MKPHIHAELIKAWADGAEIEARFLDADGWTNWRLQEGGFIWYHSNADYRIKPEPKPDVVDGIYVGVNFKDSIEVPKINWATQENANLKLIWDGETGRLKSAEVV
jgi:hypothetical protein